MTLAVNRRQSPRDNAHTPICWDMREEERSVHGSKVLSDACDQRDQRNPKWGKKEGDEG